MPNPPLGPKGVAHARAAERAVTETAGSAASFRASRSSGVLMIVENLPVPFDRRVWQEALALKAAGYRVHVICPKGGQHTRTHERLEGIDIWRHPLPLEARGPVGFLVEYVSALFFQTLLAWWVFVTRGFKVVHVANPPDLMVLVAAPFKLLGRKMIFDHHDLMPELFYEKFKSRGLAHRMTLVFERLTMRLADAVISTNASYRDIAIRRNGKRPDAVFVVRSGPDVRRFKLTEPDQAIRARARHIVGYVGIMGSQDGVDDLLRIIALYRRDMGFDDTHFVLIGDGPERPSLERLAEELGIAESVTFAGYLRGDALNRVLSTIDIGVVPDPCNDYTTKCTMNKVMEYMAMGKPLVQSDLVEGRVSAEDAALYVKNGDFHDFARKMRTLLEDGELRRQMGEYGYRRLVDHLQWSNEVPQLLAAYRYIGVVLPS